MSPDRIPWSRWAFAAAGLLFYAGLYFGVGLRATPHAHSLATPLDEMIPFRPAAIWVYASVYPAVLAPVLLVRSRARFLRVACALLAVVAICAAVFALFPVETESLRGSAELGRATGRLERFTAWGIGLLFALDPPRNAFPSLHVALATVLALGVGGSLPGARMRAAWLADVWLAAVCLSVVLVRQHYAIDAAAGLALGAVVHRIGVGEIALPEATGDFERRGALALAGVMIAFYLALVAVYATGWSPPRPATSRVASGTAPPPLRVGCMESPTARLVPTERLHDAV